MTEIEQLEAEIEYKKKLLTEMKKKRRRGSQLSFEKYKIMLDKPVFIDSYYNQKMYNTMRDFVTMWMNAGLVSYDDKERIEFPQKRPVPSDASEEQMRICNDFLDELHPIVSKYVHIFLNLNLKEVINGQ